MIAAQEFITTSRLKAWGCSKIESAVYQGEEIYFKHVGEDNPRPRLILIEKGSEHDFYKASQIRNLQERAANSFKDVSPDDVLVIIFAKNNQMKLRARNLMLINMNTAKTKICQVDEFFRPKAKQIATEYARQDSLYNANKRKYGGGGTYKVSPGGLALLYLLVAVTVICHIMMREQADLFSISKKMVFDNGQAYRLIAYMFMHNGVAHLFSNMVALCYIGSAYIRRHGGLDFYIIYFAGGVLAGFCSIYCNAYFGAAYISTVGASGAIFAVLGALLYSTLTDKYATNKSRFFLYALVVLATSSIGAHVDAYAHIGGFLAGLFIQFVIESLDIFVEGMDYDYLIKKAKRLGTKE